MFVANIEEKLQYVDEIIKIKVSDHPLQYKQLKTNNRIK